MWPRSSALYVDESEWVVTNFYSRVKKFNHPGGGQTVCVPFHVHTYLQSHFSLCRVLLRWSAGAGEESDFVWHFYGVAVGAQLNS